MCGDNRSSSGGCDKFSQRVVSLDLAAASPEGGLRIVAAEFNSYFAMFPAEASITIRVGSVAADGYELYLCPVRRTAIPFGEIFLDWAAQAGLSAKLVLGIGEEAGVR